MTMARIILGEVFVAILVFAVIYAAVAPTLQPVVFPRIQTPWSAEEGNMVTERYSLIKGENVSESINMVHLNATVKSGVVYMIFSDNPDVAFEAAFQRTSNASRLDASHSEGANRLQVNAYGETGSLNLTLGRTCQYDGSVSIRLGGVLMKLGQYTNISTLAVHIRYLGGVFLAINSGASFERFDLDMDIGGLSLNVDAENLARSGMVNVNANVGGLSMGVNVDTGLVGVGLEGTVDIGGITVNHPGFTGSVSSTQCSVKTLGYSSALNKLDVKANIGLGGVTLQQSIQSVPGFDA